MTLTIICWVTLMPSLAYSLTAFNCTTHTNIQHWGLPSDNDCQYKFLGLSKQSSSVGTLLQFPVSKTFQVKYCEIIVYTKQRYCNWEKFPDDNIKTPVQLIPEPIQLTRSQCLALHNKGTLELNGTKVTGTLGSVDITIKNTIDDSTGMCHDSQTPFKTRQYNTLIRHATITVYYSSRGLISYITEGNDILQKIPGTSQSYSNLLGIYILGNNTSYDCPWTTLYNGTLETYTNYDNKTIVTIPSLSSAFSINTSEVICNRLVEVADDDSSFIIYNSKYEDPLVTFSFEGRYSSLLQSALKYTDYTHLTTINSSLSTIITNQCNMEAMIRKEIFLDARLSPHSVGLKLFGELGWLCIPAGQALTLKPCEPVNVKIQALDHCTTSIPVIIEHTNQSSYMDPITRILSHHTYKIDCSDLSNPYFMIRDKWYKLTPFLTTIDPPTLYYSHLIKTSVTMPFNKIGLYSTEIIQNMDSKPNHLTKLEEIKYKINYNHDSGLIPSNNMHQYQSSSWVDDILHPFSSLTFISTHIWNLCQTLAIIMIIINIFKIRQQIKTTQASSIVTPMTNITIEQPDTSNNGQVDPMLKPLLLKQYAEQLGLVSQK